MSSDERLVKRATLGDPQAFEAIYQRYHQDLYRFCLAMLGNAQDAQDTLQNTMVKVLRALPGEGREIQLKPWLYRIARNESVETLRKRRDSDELEPHQTTSSGVTETVENRERLRTLLADLEQLPERQRAALVMRELSGLDFDQIGAAFGSSAAVARQTLYEARLSLRQLEVGREMRCAEVMQELSDGDGRVTRRREIQAHLRGCADCRAFRDDIGKRHEDLAALAPLPLATSAALLQGVLGKAATTGGVAVGGGSLAGNVGSGAAQAVATSTIVKSAATIAVVAVVGVSAADRGGLVDLPLPGESGPSATQGVTEPRNPTGELDSEARANAAPSGGDETAVKQAGGNATGDHINEGRQSNDDAAPEPLDDPVATPDSGSSGSPAGMNPPGGGYGRSASERGGRPDALPDAASHGQQTAAANKPTHAASTPGKGASGGSQGQQAGSVDRAKPESTPPSNAKAPGAMPAPGPSPDAPSKPDGVPPGQGEGAKPPGLQR